MERTLGDMFHDPRSCALVAVKFSESSERLLDSMQTFSQKTSLRIRAVHVINQYGDGGESYPDPFGYESSPHILREKELAYADADGRLKEMLEAHGFSESERRVVYNLDVAQGLLGESEDCQLLVLGTGAQSFPRVPKIFSCVLSVMADSKNPVLIVRNGGVVDFTKNPKVLVVDALSGPDMRKKSEAFAEAIGAGELLHAGSGKYFKQEFPFLLRSFHPVVTVMERRGNEHFLVAGTAQRNLHFALNASQSVLLFPTNSA